MELNVSESKPTPIIVIKEILTGPVREECAQLGYLELTECGICKMCVIVG